MFPRADSSARPDERVAPSPGPTTDPLSDSLLYLAAHHGRPLSRDALLAALPITDGKLNIGLYDRAARRAGLESEPVKRPIRDIPALVLPAVLIMRDGSTRILVENSGTTAQAQVINPTVRGAPPQPLADPSRATKRP